MTVRLAPAMHDALRRESYVTRKAISAIVTEAIDRYQAEGCFTVKFPGEPGVDD